MQVGTKSVVLLDDERAYLEMMTILLQDGLSCPVHGFTRPQAALETLRTQAVGVMVTDYSMPGVTGLELIEQAQTEFPQVPFILITGHGQQLNQAISFSRYPSLKAILHKPFDWRVLADTIRAHWPDKDPPSLIDHPRSP